MPAETSLGALAKVGHCGIEHLEDVIAWMEDGRQLVAIRVLNVGKAPNQS